MSSSAPRVVGRRLLRRSPRARDRQARGSTSLHPGLPDAEAADCVRWPRPLAADLASLSTAPSSRTSPSRSWPFTFRASPEDGMPARPRTCSCATPGRISTPARCGSCRGASMIELMPNIEWHKGSAVQWIRGPRRTPIGRTCLAGLHRRRPDGRGWVPGRRRTSACRLPRRPAAAGADLAVDGPSGGRSAAASARLPALRAGSVTSREPA